MTRRVLLTVCLLGGLALPLVAQEQAPRRMRPGQAPGGPGPANEVFKVVDAYVLSNLQESLGLTDEQFVKLLPLVKRVQSERREFAQRRARTMMELRKLLASGAATESRVVERLTELKTIENDEPQALRKSRDAIDAALSPLQQAKYRVLEGDVERRIRELMRELGARGPGARGQRPNNPEPEPPQPPQE